MNFHFHAAEVRVCFAWPLLTSFDLSLSYLFLCIVSLPACHRFWPQALAEALKVNKTVTKINLCNNSIGMEGAEAWGSARASFFFCLQLYIKWNTLHLIEFLLNALSIYLQAQHLLLQDMSTCSNCGEKRNIQELVGKLGHCFAVSCSWSSTFFRFTFFWHLSTSCDLSLSFVWHPPQCNVEY